MSVTWQWAVRASEWCDPAATLITSSPVKDLIHRGWSLQRETAWHGRHFSHVFLVICLTHVWQIRYTTILIYCVSLIKWFIQSVTRLWLHVSFHMETELQTGCRTNCNTNFLCQMIFFYIDFCSCIRIYLYKPGYIICACVITDLASWSPWPSCPSDPRPQLHTSVSRDGSPSPASSGAAAWVRPAEDGLQAQGRRRRGDPERKTHDLMVKSW